MKTATTIGIDLAKNSFTVYGVNAKGTVHKRLPELIADETNGLSPIMCRLTRLQGSLFIPRLEDSPAA